MDLEHIIFHAVSQRKTIPYDFTYMWNLINKKISKQKRNRLRDPGKKTGCCQRRRGGRLGKQVKGIKRCRLPVAKINMALGFNIQQREYSQQYCNTLVCDRLLLDVCSDQFAMYVNTQSLCCLPETNIILYIYCISIKNENSGGLIITIILKELPIILIFYIA